MSGYLYAKWAFVNPRISIPREHLLRFSEALQARYAEKRREWVAKNVAKEV